MALTKPNYLSKLRHFEQLFDDRTSIALGFFPAGSRPAVELSRYRHVSKAALDELAALYNSQFVDCDLPPARQGDLTILEANIAMATQQNLEIMRRMIKLQRAAGFEAVKSFRLQRLSHWMHRTSTSLERRENVPFSIRISIPQLLQAGRKPFATAATLVTATVLRKSLTEMTDALDPSNFFRSPDVRFEGVEKTRAALSKYPRYAMVMIANHDLGIYDATLAHRLSQLMGCQRHMAINRKTVWPIAPPDSAGDVIYVDEGDPKHRPIPDSIRRVRDALATNDRVSLAIYPEGMMPFTGAQMPLVTKDGAFIIARMLADNLSGESIPVLLVEFESNILTHLTISDVVDPVISITDISVVPTGRLTKGQTDEWIASRRLKAEERFNVGRGERMLDIVSPGPLPNSMTYEARETIGSVDHLAKPAR